MYRMQRYEPIEVAAGTPVTVLVSHRMGPWVFIPLHALPDRPAAELMAHYSGGSAQGATWWREVSEQVWSEKEQGYVPAPKRLVYVVGVKALEKMREVLELEPGDAWPEEVNVVHLHG